MLEGPITFDRTIRIIGSILIIILLIYVVATLSNVLLPFFAAWLIAYMLNPFVDFLQNKAKLKNRTLCVIITLLLLLGITLGGVTFVASSFSKEWDNIQILFANYVSGNYDHTISPETKAFVTNTIDTIQKNKEEIMQHVLPTAYNVLSSSVRYLSGLFVAFLIILYMFFILMDYDKMSDSWMNVVPYKYRKMTRQVFHDLASGMNIYFRKQALISFIVGCLFAIGFKILGLPMGITMGMIVGALNMIPYMHTLGAIPPILVALVQSAQTDSSFWMLLLGILIVFCVVQVILDTILTPKIMGQATGLKPAVILLSLSIWGSLLGVLGMIIALPITTMIISYYKHFIIEKKSGDELVEQKSKHEAGRGKEIHSESK